MELKNPKDKGPRKIPETGVERVVERRRTDAHPKMRPVIKEYVPQGLRRTLTNLEGKRISKPNADTIQIGDDVRLSSDIEIKENLVVEGSLTIGDRCRFHRGVKVSKDVEIGSDVVVEENLIVGGIANIGRDTVINGSVDAKGSVCLGKNVYVGLSLISGGDVELHENARVAKNILCRGYIRVLPSQESKKHKPIERR